MNTKPNTPASRNEALRDLLRYAESNECHHENTHRGGAIWTICDDCDMKWADDRGGFVPYVEPIEIANARAALAALAAPGAAIDAGGQEPVISVEDSLRTRLRWSQEKVEQLEQENRELRGRLPGPSFDDLMACTAGRHPLASRPEAPPASASPATVAQPVGWQVRGIGRDDGPGEWRHADDEDVEIYRNTPDTWELRPVFAQPCASQGCGGAVAIADRVVRLVGEMDDRTSPEDWPEAMLVTGDELHAFILQSFEQEAEAAQPCASQGCGGAVIDLAHELYAMAQGPRPIEDAVQAMVERLSALSTAKSVEHGATDGGS